MAILECLTVQPLQAKKSGGVGAGAEGEAWVQQQVDCLRVNRLAPAGADPKALPALDRLEVAHPFPLPILVFEYFNAVGRQGRRVVAGECLDHAVHIGRGVKQPGDAGAVPHRSLIQAGLIQGLIGIVLEGYSGRAQFQQGVFEGFGVVAISIQL